MNQPHRHGSGRQWTSQPPRVNKNFAWNRRLQIANRKPAKRRCCQQKVLEVARPSLKLTNPIFTYWPGKYNLHFFHPPLLLKGWGFSRPFFFICMCATARGKDPPFTKCGSADRRPSRRMLCKRLLCSHQVSWVYKPHNYGKKTTHMVMAGRVFFCRCYKKRQEMSCGIIFLFSETVLSSFHIWVRFNHKSRCDDPPRCRECATSML